MADRLRIFVSVGPDLEAEREVVGQAIASLPISLGWEIKYTPFRGERSDPSAEVVANCDFYALLLGADISAPMGSELRTAMTTGKRIIAFLKEGPRTAAARFFARQSGVAWMRFGNEESLRRPLQKSVVGQILEAPEEYRITVADWEALSALSAELEEEPSRGREEATPWHGGAGGDAVIVSPERDLPSEGVLIGGGHDSS
jgi:hypothetical protein